MDPTNNELPTPVNPVINPNNNAGAVNEMPVAQPMPEPVMPEAQPATPVPPMPPVFNPATMATPDMADLNFSATDPITMPEPVKEPDPVEQELNAPFKAAEPVPGSIGSAISVPAEGQENAEMPSEVASQPVMTAQNMTQTDAAQSNVMQQNMMQQNMMQSGQATAKPKKKMSKTTLTLLCVLAGITIVALVAVLIIELNK